ncbi:porin family protein [Aestuariivivens marinum]|uniref:porin family protein n=1 Tax=Aestuariivivens marinum TaxID=2913555 RepID=UPI001F58E6F2|nr:porin family protein [Aestuariivivens marinum]
MKKVFLLAIALIGFTVTSNAQAIADNALGLRLGDSDGFGAEVSYQRALGDNNRLEFDLGWRDGNNYDGFKLAGLYQWVFPLDGTFNWYVGAGGGLASFDVNVNTPNGPISDSETFFFAAGDIGIEYSFDIPLLISLDFRPEIGFGNFNDDLDFDIALGLRYQF